MAYSGRLSAKVLVRDSNFTVIGEVADYTQCSATLRFNDIGDWSMDVPANSNSAQLLLAEENPGAGIVIRRGSTTFFSGPVWTRQWQRDAGTGEPVLTVAGNDDNFFLRTRLIRPNPAVEDLNAAGVNYFQTASIPTESIMSILTRRNLSSAADIESRRMAGFTMGTDLGLGKVQLSPSYRFDVLLDALQQLSSLARTDTTDPLQDLGFRVVQVGTDLEFQVYALTMRPNARFSFALGNLDSATYSMTGPTATNPIVGVGGQDDENGKSIAAQLFSYARADAAYPWQIETYADGGSVTGSGVDGTIDQAAVDQQGHDALESGAGVLSASVTPIDTDRLTFGVDYQLGDFVSVELPQLTFQAPIRSVSLNLSVDGGQQVGLGIGTQDGAYSAKTPTTLAQLKALKKIIRKVIKST